MRSKILAIFLSSSISVILLNVIDYAGCLIRTCESDDASIRAAELLGFMPLIAYIVFSWIFVFPSMLLVRRWLGNFGAPLAISLIFSLAIAFLFYNPAVDSSFMQTAQLLLPWLALPWFIGGLLALALWPKD